MKTCYDCAYSKIISDGNRRGLICGIYSKNFCIPLSFPVPDICGDFRKRSGFTAWEAFSPDEQEKYSEIYHHLPSYNANISPEEFFKSMDSGFFGIYPKKGKTNEQKTD